MTESETKERNIALALYMGWKQDAHDRPWYYSEHGRVIHEQRAWEVSPPFDTDMNLLMPVVWKLMGDRDEGFHLNPGGGGYMGSEATFGERGGCTARFGLGQNIGWNKGLSPAEATWLAVSSLVMELQRKTT